MFTGIVKLAQVDDYITPSQNCIQPKIMKPTQKQKATVSLNDCLACSGCLTSAESVLVEQMSVGKLIAELGKVGDKNQVHFLVAPQVVLSIARTYNIHPIMVFKEISQFFKHNFKTGLVLDLWQGIIHCHRLITQQYLQTSSKTLLCSQCPGWVCYAQKTLTQNVVQLMSKVKSPQQIMANLLKEKERECMVVSIMPCYDKKLEAIRFDIQEKIKELDITITTVQFLELYKTVTGKEFKETMACQQQINEKQQLMIDRLFACNYGKGYRLTNDPSSNGYLQHLILNLGGESVTKKQVRNSDFIQYEFITKGEKIKMAKCYGFRNIQKVVQAIKKGKCQYRYVQIMACPGGCYSGGGQIKSQTIKPKEMLQAMSTLAKELIVQTKEEDICGEVLEQRGRFETKYKVIEKSLTQSVMNW